MLRVGLCAQHMKYNADVTTHGFVKQNSLVASDNLSEELSYVDIKGLKNSVAKSSKRDKGSAKTVIETIGEKIATKPKLVISRM